MDELKPCPFCGGEAELFTIPADYGLSPIRWVIRCKKGCCEQIPHISDHDAVFAWNKRNEGKRHATAIWRGWTKSYYKGRDDDDEPIWGRCTYYICSNCGRRTVIADQFCPGCGASMEKEM